MKIRLSLTTLAVFFMLIFSDFQSWSQITLTTAPTAYQFTSSIDRNIHPGLNIRFGYDYNRFQFDFGFSGYFPVQTVIKTDARERNPSNPLFPATISILNTVDGYSWESSIQMNYFLYGQPIGGKGWQSYGFVGSSLFIYQQVNNLSHFNTLDYQASVSDGAETTYSQITIDLGLGLKYPLRNKEFFAEGRFSFPTDLEKDYKVPVQTTYYYSATIGIRWHIVTRKSVYQHMANRKRKPNLR